MVVRIYKIMFLSRPAWKNACSHHNGLTKTKLVFLGQLHLNISGLLAVIGYDVTADAVLPELYLSKLSLGRTAFIGGETPQPLHHPAMTAAGGEVPWSVLIGI